METKFGWPWARPWLRCGLPLTHPSFPPRGGHVTVPGPALGGWGRGDLPQSPAPPPPALRSWTPASPPPQPPSCSGQGEDSSKGTLSRGRTGGGARPDTPRAHTHLPSRCDPCSCHPSTLARPQATGAGPAPRGGAKAGRGYRRGLVGRAAAEGARAAGRWDGGGRSARGSRTRVGSGFESVLGSSVVPTPPHPTPSHSQARGAISPVPTLGPGFLQLHHLCANFPDLRSVAVPAPLLGLIFAPVRAGLS